MRRVAIGSVIAFLILVPSIWFSVRRTEAAPQVVLGSACVAYVPQAWGEFKGGSQQTGLAFQDNAGTLRFVTSLPCDGTPQVALEIRRTSGN